MSDNNRGSPPSMPDAKPSRGENPHDESSASARRHSKSSRGSKSSHRRSGRSSTRKSERSPTEEHSPSHHSSGHSSRRSSGHSSTKRRSSTSTMTPESSKSRQSRRHLLRLADGAEGIHSTPVHHSDNNDNHSGRSTSKRSYSRTSSKDHHSGRSSMRSSTRTSARYSKTPDSKRRHSSSRKLRLAEAGSVAPPPPPLLQNTTTPDSKRRHSSSRKLRLAKAGSVAPPPPSLLQDTITTTTGSATRSGASSSTTTSVPREVVQDSSNTATLEQATAETAALQERPGDNLVFVAAPAPKEDRTAIRYVFAAFVIVVVAAAVVVWRVMMVNNDKSKDDPAPVTGPTPFDPPTQEDCLAVSQGLAVSGQSETSVRTFAVEINFAVTSGMNLALLKAELEIRTQGYVLPLLTGCQTDAPIIIENNTFVIANAILETVNMNTPQTGCNLLDSQSTLCSLAYMEMDLFLKDPEVPSGLILEMIDFVFQHNSLLEVLDLLTPVKTIDSQQGYEVVASPTARPVVMDSSAPTDSPSMAPTAKPTVMDSSVPTPIPTISPTRMDSSVPTPSPTISPTRMDSSAPTLSPTISPTRVDSSVPTFSPTARPTVMHSSVPTEQPSSAPTMTTRAKKVKTILAEYSPWNEQTLNWLIFVDTWEPDAEDPNHDYLWLERYAMALLFDSTDGSSWTNSNNWKTSEPVCNWYFYNNQNECPGPITFLDLWKNNIKGSLPPIIGELSQLTALYMWDNQLTSSIPSSIGNLSLLRHLWLGDNQLTSIPSSIGNLIKLKALNLANNQLASSIPSSLGNLSLLEGLWLYNNQFTGSIPSLPSSLTNCMLGNNCFGDFGNGITAGCSVPSNCA